MGTRKGGREVVGGTEEKAPLAFPHRSTLVFIQRSPSPRCSLSFTLFPCSVSVPVGIFEPNLGVVTPGEEP